MARMNPMSLLCRWPRAAGIVLVLLSVPALYAATPPLSDSMEQRLAACTSCHGAHGAGSPEDTRIPRLAGKPAAYLRQQLEYFRTGKRHHAAMEYVVRQLSPDYLNRIAAYFASQEVPVHRHPVPALPAQVLARGEQLVRHGDPARGVPSCQSCHGERLTGVQPMMPGLAGLTYDYIRTQLTLWRSNGRTDEGMFCMGVVANRMRPGDIQAVSAWLAGQPAPPDMRPLASRDEAEPLPGWCVLGHAGANP